MNDFISVEEKDFPLLHKAISYFLEYGTYSPKEKKRIEEIIDDLEYQRII